MPITMRSSESRTTRAPPKFADQDFGTAKKKAPTINLPIKKLKVGRDILTCSAAMELRDELEDEDGGSGSEEDGSEENIKPTRRATNTLHNNGKARGTPSEATYKAVEKRLRDARLWKPAVDFHDQLDLFEIKDPAFAIHREHVRMHMDEDGRVTSRPDGSKSASSAPLNHGAKR